MPHPRSTSPTRSPLVLACVAGRPFPACARASLPLLLAIVLAWTGTLAAARPAVAQPAANGVGAASTEEGAAPAAPRPAPIPIARIGVESENAKGRVAQAVASLEPRPQLLKLAADIPKRAAEVDALVEHSSELRAREPGLVEVDQVRTEWGALVDALDRMQVAFGQRSGEISRVRESLSSDLAVWKATAEAARGEEDAVRAQIDDVVSAIEKAIDEAKAAQGRIAAWQGEVASLTGRARADLAALAEVRRSLVGRILERDRTPMTSPAFFGQLSRAEVERRIAEHGDREVAAFVRFVERHRERLALHAAATLMLLLVTLGAQGRIRQFQAAHREEDPALEAMSAVFEHPIALALLLSLFVGIWGYAELPPLAAPIFGAMALLPAVLILRQLVEPPVRPVLYVLLALYFVDRLNAVIAPLPSLPRVVFLAELIAFFALVLWWRRPARLTDVPLAARTSGSFRFLALGLRIALFAMPAAMLAEIAGYTALARVVGGTVLSAGYVGIMLYASTIAAYGFVAFLLRVRPLTLSGMVQRHRDLIGERVQRVVQWVAAGLFVYVLLDRLEIRIAAGEVLSAFWEHEIPLIAVSVTFGSIIEFGLVVWVTLQLSRFVQFALEEEVYTRVRMRKGQPYAVSTLTRYIVLLVGFILAIFALGVDINRFTVLAGAFGVGIGFGLQTIVNNFVSGIILLTEQPVQVGDTVELEGVLGEVQRIGIRSSTVRTWQGAEVIVPNAQLVSEQVTNWTLSDQRRRIEIPVGVAYGTDPSRVIGILEAAAGGHEHVLSQPAPAALFLAFGDSALEFELRCWTDRADAWIAIKSALMVQIEAALGEAGITIPFPQRDLHLKSIEASVAEGLAGRGEGEPRAGSEGAEAPARRAGAPRSAPRLAPRPSAAPDDDDG